MSWRSESIPTYVFNSQPYHKGTEYFYSTLAVVISLGCRPIQIYVPETIRS